MFLRKQLVLSAILRDTGSHCTNIRNDYFAFIVIRLKECVKSYNFGKKYESKVLVNINIGLVISIGHYVNFAIG